MYERLGFDILDVDIIVESANYRAHPEDWPLSDKLDLWKSNIRVGDMVDAKSSNDNQFYEATVTAVEDYWNTFQVQLSSGESCKISSMNRYTHIQPLGIYSGISRSRSGSMSPPADTAEVTAVVPTIIDGVSSRPINSC